MTNEVAANSSLPASVTNMAANLAASIHAVGGAGGSETYMKFTKFGEWVYGMEGTETQEGSIWAVNPAQFLHGWTAWGTEAHGTDGQNVGEHMVNAGMAYPSEADLPQVKGNWSKAIAMMLRCTTGEDKGTQVLFKSNSLGGRKAYAGLIQKVVERIQAGETEVVALVELESDSYQHGTYGKIFTPVMKIVGWTGLDGAIPEEEPQQNAAAVEQPAVEPEQEEKPRRRRRKAS